MKKQNLAILFVALFFASCAKLDSGQLIGVQDRPDWYPIQPYGMQYVPSGTLHIGPSDQDVNHALVQRPKQISIQGFFMDDTEITNNEYRQFVNWVRDSIAHIQLGHTREYPGGVQGVDWDQEVSYEPGGELDGMFYQGDEQFGGQRNLDVRQLVFDYQWYDWKGAAQDFSWADDYNRASKEKHNRADYTALTTWGVFFNEEENAHHIVLLNSIKDRLEFPELKELSMQEYADWEPDSFIVEKKSAGTAIYQEMRRMGLPVQEYTPHRGSGDKLARLNSVADIVASGMVWVPQTRWAEEVVEEIAGFPFMSHDDLVDSTVMALMRFRQGGFIRLPSDEPDPIRFFKQRRGGYY